MNLSVLQGHFGSSRDRATSRRIRGLHLTRPQVSPGAEAHKKTRGKEQELQGAWAETQKYIYMYTSFIVIPTYVWLRTPPEKRDKVEGKYTLALFSGVERIDQGGGHGRASRPDHRSRPDESPFTFSPHPPSLRKRGVTGFGLWPEAPSLAGLF